MWKEKLEEVGNLVSSGISMYWRRGETITSHTTQEDIPHFGNNMTISLLIHSVLS